MTAFIASRKNITALCASLMVLLPAHAALASESFCSALVDIESTLSSSIPLTFMPPDVARQVADQQLNIIEPLFATATTDAPQALSEAMNTYATATLQSLKTLDFAPMQTGEFAAADDSIDTHLLTDCGFQKMPVTATNYEYLNVQEKMPSGKIALTIANEGDEVHEISIARINDDVNMTAREILMLGEEDALAVISLKAYATAAPGEAETTFMNLSPGRYYAVCFVAQGTTSFHEHGDGPPHFLRGMLKEFVVE